MKQITVSTSARTMVVPFPESPEELTWGQIVRLTKMEEAEAPAMSVAILTGTDHHFWRDLDKENLRAYLLLEREALSIVNSAFKLFVDPGRERLSNKIKILGQEVQMPADIGYVSIGQYQDCIALHHQFAAGRDGWEKDAEGNAIPPISDTIALYGDLFRIYAQPLIDGEYDFQKARALHIDNVGWLDVIAWAYFFLSSVIKLKSGTEQKAPRQRTRRMRAMQAFRSLVSALGFRSRSTR